MSDDGVDVLHPRRYGESLKPSVIVPPMRPWASTLEKYAHARSRIDGRFLLLLWIVPEIVPVTLYKPTPRHPPREKPKEKPAEKLRTSQRAVSCFGAPHASALPGCATPRATTHCTGPRGAIQGLLPR